MHDACQGVAGLSVCEVGREFPIPRHQGERLEGCHAVRDAASEDWECSLRRHEALEDYGELLCAAQCAVVVFLIVETCVGLGVNHRL